MVKRVGANGRKINASRKSKRKHTMRKLAVKTIAAMLVVGGGAFVVFLGYDGLMKIKDSYEDSSLLSVKNVFVKGTANVPEEKVLALSGLKTGMKIYKISEKRIDTLLSRNPWIESVKLAKSLQGIVKLEIIERKPVAIINMGTVGLIDMHGVILPLKSGIPTSLPLVSGLRDSIDSHGRKNITADGMKRLKDFFKQVRLTDENLMSTISQIDLSDREKIKITFQSCPTIFELDAGSVALRLNHLKQLEGVLQGMAQVPARINLCYQNLAFVTQPVAVKNEVIQAVSD